MKHTLTASAALLTLATFSISAQTQAKTDNEALALIMKAKEQEQKIVRGRLKVRSQQEWLSDYSAAESRKMEQMLLKAGYSTYDASKLAQSLRDSPRTKRMPMLSNYTFAFDASRMVFLEKRKYNTNQQSRRARTETEDIRATTHGSVEAESSPEFRWEYETDRRKRIMAAGSPSSVWLGRGWDSIAPEGWKADYRVLEKHADGTVVLLRSDTSPEGSKDFDVKVWMDTKRDYILTHVQYIFRKSGHVQTDIVYTYDRREDGIYYPKEAIETRFHENDEGKWVLSERVVSHIEKAEINIPISPSELKIDIP